ncbi:hypothetical protein NKJ55_32020 [Mesorhizobium sp. M0106]|uniref:hypothetical protein n=1 Tax=Mesorhizobium sp. M0106 TaxID=2956880 RepID=UPI00333C4F99
MQKLNEIIREIDGRNERLSDKLADVESVVWDAVADNDDVLTDNDMNAVAEASAVAAMLLTAAHAVALGLSADGHAFQQKVQEAMVGLSILADRALPSDQDDDECEGQ